MEKSIQIDYTFNLIDILDAINTLLKVEKLQLVGDGKDHNGFEIITLEKIE